MHARSMCRISGFALACRRLASNLRATFADWHDANSSEFDPATPHRVIYKLRELRGVEELGGTMRLGAWPCKLEPGTLACKIYGQNEISERHRHRYEFNREYEDTMTAGGLKISGSTPDGTYVEIVEIPGHPYLHWLPVPSRIQVEAARAASAFQVVHRCILRAWPETKEQEEATEVEMFLRPQKVVEDKSRVRHGVMNTYSEKQ